MGKTGVPGVIHTDRTEVARVHGYPSQRKKRMTAT